MNYVTADHPDQRIAEFAAELGLELEDKVRAVEIAMLIDLGATVIDAENAREAWNRSRPMYGRGTYWGYARVVIWGRIADRREAATDAVSNGAL